MRWQIICTQNQFCCLLAAVKYLQFYFLQLPLIYRLNYNSWNTSPDYFCILPRALVSCQQTCNVQYLIHAISAVMCWTVLERKQAKASITLKLFQVIDSIIHLLAPRNIKTGIQSMNRRMQITVRNKGRGRRVTRLSGEWLASVAAPVRDVCLEWKDMS